MIKIAELPIVRAQLERAAAASQKAQVQPGEPGAESGQVPARTQPDLVLENGKYYVANRAK